MNVDFEIEENGALVVSADVETRESLLAVLIDGGQSWLGAVRDLFESETCNGGLTPFQPGDGTDSPFVGLTDSLCVAEHGIGPDDSGAYAVQGRLWVDSRYDTRDLLSDIVVHGSYTFAPVPGHGQTGVE